MNFITDIKYALRTMKKNIRFSALTIFVMTIGLSLCVFMFSFIYNTLTAPLPFEDGERVRMVRGIQNNFFAMPLHDFEDLKKAQQSFEIFDTYDNGLRNINTGDRSIRENTLFVNEDFFKISDAKPLIGRLLTNADGVAGAEPVALIGENLWKRLYASDPDILGNKIRIENTPHTIVGVMPMSYRFPESANLWIPFTLSTKGVARRESPLVNVYGRLKPGVSNENAQRDLSLVMADLKTKYPKLNAESMVYVRTFQEVASRNDQSLILAMKLCVGLVMLLACINTGNLLLSRALEKAKETAVRSALGAPRGRLIGQVMAESLVICLLSAVLALFIANWGLETSLNELSRMFRASEAPFWWEFGLTAEAIFAGISFSLFIALLTGFLPAWLTSRDNVSEVLRDGTRGAQSKASGRVSKTIVIVEIALSCALLLLAAAMTLSVYQKREMDFGVKVEGYLTAEVSLSQQQYDTDDKKLQYYRELEQVLEQNARVEEVSFTRNLPFTWFMYPSIKLEGEDYGKDPKFPRTEFITVDNDYFKVMEVDLIEGRHFDNQDRAESPLSAVVTNAFVEKYFKGQSPLGKRFQLVDGDQEWYTIIGVVKSVAHTLPWGNKITRPGLFVNLEQHVQRSMNIVVKTKVDPEELREHLANSAFKVEPESPLFNVRTIQRLKDRAFADLNFISGVFLVFAIASALLAFSGIYGVMANTIVQKTQEVGIRKALGADDGEVLKHFLTKSSWQLLIGLAIGVPGGIALVNMLSETDLVVTSTLLMVLIPLVIALLSFAAVISPIRRTLKMEPIIALRYE